MPSIEILDSGIIDNRDSSFPTLVRLDYGDILAGFTVGGGPFVNGGTELARSRQRQVLLQGTILTIHAPPIRFA